MILHLLRMRRNVNRNVFNDRENVSATTALHQTQVFLHRATESYVGLLLDDARFVAFRCDPVGNVELEVVNDSFAVLIRNFDLEAFCEPPILSRHHTERHARIRRQADSVEGNFELAANREYKIYTFAPSNSHYIKVNLWFYDTHTKF